MDLNLQLIHRVAVDQKMEMRQEIERRNRQVDEFTTKPAGAAASGCVAEPRGAYEPSHNPWGFRHRRRPVQELF
jgi:hypothetical protein